MHNLTTLTSPSFSSPALLLTALLAAGCGGSGGDASSNSGPGEGDDQHQNGPTADVAFPPAHVETSSSLVYVRGTTTSPEEVASIQVNGSVAQTADGWATWEAKVQLLPGENLLTTTLLTVDGEEVADPDQQTVFLQETQVGDPVDMAYSAGHGPVLWYLDDSQVLGHDLLAESILPISGPDAGLGPDIHEPSAITVDPDGEFAFVLCEQAGEDQVLRINTSTGMRERLDNPMPGSELDECTDLACLRFFGQNQHVDVLYVTTRKFDTVYLIDASTGEVGMVNIGLNEPVGTTAIDVSGDGANPQVAMIDTMGRLLFYNGNAMEVVASGGDGLGEIWSWGTDVQLMPNGNILVTDRHSGDIYHVDTWNWQRTTLDPAMGAHGMAFQDLCAIESFEFDNQTAIVALDKGLDLCAGMDDVHAEWEVVMDTRVGEGVSMNLAFGLAQAGQSFVASSVLPGEIVRIDPGTGSRTALANWNEPGMFHITTAICTDDAEGVAYFTEALMGSITAMDLQAGAMGTVTGLGIGEGPALPLDAEVGLACDDAGQRLLVAVDDTLFAVDLQTGDRSILSGPGVGQGHGLFGASCIALDPAQDRALIGGVKAVYSVDLTTGDRQIVSSAFVGGGPELYQVTSLAYSPEAGELLVGNEQGSYLLRIDEATGNRSEAFANGHLGAAPFSSGSLHWDTEDRTAYMLDVRRGSLKVVDLDRGQWMTVSR